MWWLLCGDCLGTLAAAHEAEGSGARAKHENTGRLRHPFRCEGQLPIVANGEGTFVDAVAAAGGHHVEVECDAARTQRKAAFDAAVEVGERTSCRRLTTT